VRRKAAAVSVGVGVLLALVTASGLYAVVTAEDTTRFVPDTADVAVRLNATALADDTATRALVNATESGVVTDVLDATRAAPDTEEATAFLGPEPRNGTYAAAVVRAERPLRARDAEESGFEVTESAYNALPFYELRASDDAHPFYAAPVARRVYVVGTERAVRDASDVAWRNAPALGEEARDELRSDAPVGFVATNPPLSDVDAVHGGYTPDGDRVSVEARFRPSDGAGVGDVRRSVDAYLGTARLLGDDAVTDALRRVEVTGTEDAVVVEYDGTVSDASEASRAADRLFGWRRSLRAALGGYVAGGYSSTAATSEKNNDALTTALTVKNALPMSCSATMCS